MRKTSFALLASILLLACATSAWAQTELVDLSDRKAQAEINRLAGEGYRISHIAALLVDDTPRGRGIGMLVEAIRVTEEHLAVMQKSGGAKAEYAVVKAGTPEKLIREASPWLAQGYRLLPGLAAGKRRWQVDSYVEEYYAVLEKQSGRWVYQTVDLQHKKAEEKMKAAIGEGYAAVGILTPTYLLMERSAESTGPLRAKYSILQNMSMQKLQMDVNRESALGFHVRASGVSATNAFITLVLEVGLGSQQTQYLMIEHNEAAEMESLMNGAAEKGFRMVASHGVGPVGMKPLSKGQIAERAVVLMERTAWPREFKYRVSIATSRGETLKLLRAATARVAGVVATKRRNFVIVEEANVPAASAAVPADQSNSSAIK